MKVLYTLTLCLCVIFAYSQTKQTNSSDGTYIFQKATFTAYNYDSKAEVDTRTIDNAALLDTTDMFFQKVFLKATIENDLLSFCTLPDQREYKVEDQLTLVPAPTKELSKRDYTSNISMQLSPYTFLVNNNILTFTFIYSYGDSRYSFPLEGKLTVSLTKEKDQ